MRPLPDIPKSVGQYRVDTRVAVLHQLSTSAQHVLKALELQCIWLAAIDFEVSNF